MRIFGVSLLTIALVIAALYLGRKYGGSIPIIKSLP